MLHSFDTNSGAPFQTPQGSFSDSFQHLDHDSHHAEKHSTAKKPLLIALQGGGSHGAFSWGVLDALMEDGRFFIEGLSGTSAGGMNALAFMQGFMEGGAQGARESLKKFWKTVSEMSKLSPYKAAITESMAGRFGLDTSPSFVLAHAMTSNASPYQWNPLNINPLQLMIEDFFHFQKLRAYHDVKVFLCATHVKTGKLKIFENKDLCPEVIMASACLPKLFHAVDVNGQFYWDGGYAGNPAIFPLIEKCQGVDILIIQLVRQSCLSIPKSIQDIEARMMEINNNLSLMREIRAISFITKLIDQGHINVPLKRLYMHMVHNEILFDQLAQTSALNTDWEFLTHLFDWGHRSAKDWIRLHFHDVGVRSSFDIDHAFVTEEV